MIDDDDNDNDADDDDGDDDNCCFFGNVRFKTGRMHCSFVDVWSLQIKSKPKRKCPEDGHMNGRNMSMVTV